VGTYLNNNDFVPFEACRRIIYPYLLSGYARDF
jgi:hypothetical protein